MSDWSMFCKNMVLFAPTKAEAKRSVSRGLIRLEIEVRTSFLVIKGAATDDFISILAETEVLMSEAKTYFATRLLKAALRHNGNYIGYWLPEQLKPGTILEMPSLSEDPDFDKRFWVEHVVGSANDQALVLASEGVTFNPSRLRKLALMEPRDAAVTWTYVEWADRSIIRWHTDTAKGVYAPVGMW